MSCGRKVNPRKDGNVPMWCKPCNAKKMKQFNEIFAEVMSK